MTRTTTEPSAAVPAPAPASRSGSRRAGWSRSRRGLRLLAGALLAALLSAVAVSVVVRIWDQPLHVPFQYAQVPGDDEQDATLDMMLIKNVHEQGWFNTNPKLNAPFEQHWAEWPMGGDLLAYTIKKGIVDATGDVPLTFNLFWLLTFPLTALVAFPVLRSLRCSWGTSLAGSVLFGLAPYHWRNGVGHENLAFYVGIPIIVLACVRILGPPGGLPRLADLRHWSGWWRLKWLLLGSVLVGITGIYYLAFLLCLLALTALLAAVAYRRPDRLVFAVLLGGVGLAASFVANLPTLLYRWQHAPNILGVPDRRPGVSEGYPLRIVELLSPVAGHRFGPLAALADQLYDPNRQGLGTAMLGLAAAIGFVAAIVALLVRGLRGRERRAWPLEARLGVVILGALFLGTQGGLSRALELVGLSGVRAWTRIAIVVAFAAIVVFARMLDRLRASMYRRGRPIPRLAWTSLLVVVVVLGILDQAAPTILPKPGARERVWDADARFVSTMERRLPRDAMVFQLPVVDFPEHGSIRHMSAHDLIKETYLHSRDLRWSAGGMRGRSGEWQWPAAQLKLRDLVRSVRALGFSAIMLDRDGYQHHGRHQLHSLTKLLGPPIATRGKRLAAWDLPATLVGDLTPPARAALARATLDSPRQYLETDVDPIRDRGDEHFICADGTLTFVNPGRHSVRRVLDLDFRSGQSSAEHGTVAVNGHRVRITADEPNAFVVTVPPGTTTHAIRVHTPVLRCASAPRLALASISAVLEPIPTTVRPAR